MAINNVTDLYRNILGREPDAEGLAFWEQAFGDTIDSNEIDSFKTAAQSALANRSPEEQSLLAPKIVNPTSTGFAQQYLDANPDVKAEFERFKTREPSKWTPESYVAYHYRNYGRNETRAGTEGLTKNIDTLANQILGQKLTSQWKGQGYGSAEANAKDMATILTGIGITDIKQFGKVPVYSPVQEIGKTYNGQQVVNMSDEEGKTVSYIRQPTGAYQYDYETGQEYPVTQFVPVPANAKLESVYGQYDPNYDTVNQVDQSKIKTINGQLVVDTGQTSFGNKATGQAVPNTYSERQTGNAWGGTFAGDGNTGYRVQFTPDGTPIFYTTYSTSNDLAMLMQDLGPIGQIGLALATGGLSIPQQIAAQMAIQVLSGVDLDDAIKNAVVSLAVSNIPGTDMMKEANKYITDLGLPAALTTTLNNAVQTAVVTGAKAVLTGQDLSDAVVRGFTSGGLNGAVNALLPNIDGFKELSNTQKKLITNAVVGTVSGKPLDQVLINTAISAANAEVAQQRKLNAPLDEKAISELTAEEKAIYDEYGTKGLKYSADITKLLAGINSGSSENTDSGLSNQDILDMIYGGTDAGGNITDTTGLDTGETISGGTDGTETLNVTGNKDVTGVDTSVTNNVITKGNNIGTVTVTDCGPGKVRNAAGICENINCGEGKYWDPVTKQCELKKVDTVEVKDTGTDKGTVTVTACGEGKVRNAAGICVPIDCGDGKYWDPVTKQCELKKVETVTVDDKGADKGIVTVTACGPGKVRNAKGDCVDIDCGEGKFWDPTTGKCELKKIDTVDITDKTDKIKTVEVTACGEGKVRNAKGDCVDIDCGDGKYWDPITKQCELKKVETVEVKGDGTDTITVTACGDGKVRNAAGICVPIDCGDGKYWDPITKQCEVKKVDDITTTLVCGANEEKSPDGKSCIPKCGTGYKRGPDGITCVPITTTVQPAGCPPGQTKNAAGVCVPITTTTTPTTPSFVPAGIATSSETTNPIYAGAMDDFNLFATLNELLTDDENKKTTQQTQQTTKMATGGHLDDLLAEQMTVDDLLNLLR
jgi:ribosomal protein L12E/L44/L45/RPP1/RPP2